MSSNPASENFRSRSEIRSLKRKPACSLQANTGDENAEWLLLFFLLLLFGVVRQHLEGREFLPGTRRASSNLECSLQLFCLGN